MRLKAGDPEAVGAMVTLDGSPVTMCVELDTDEGWCDCLTGRMTTEDELEIQRRHGTVVVEFRPSKSHTDE